MYPDQYVRLCYEDLARSPREAVSRLFQKLLVEGEVQFEALGRAPNRHQLHGKQDAPPPALTWRDKGGPSVEFRHAPGPSATRRSALEGVRSGVELWMSATNLGTRHPQRCGR